MEKNTNTFYFPEYGSDREKRFACLINPENVQRQAEQKERTETEKELMEKLSGLDPKKAEKVLEMNKVSNEVDKAIGDMAVQFFDNPEIAAALTPDMLEKMEPSMKKLGPTLQKEKMKKVNALLREYGGKAEFDAATGKMSVRDYNSGDEKQDKKDRVEATVKNIGDLLKNDKTAPFPAAEKFFNDFEEHIADFNAKDANEALTKLNSVLLPNDFKAQLEVKEGKFIVKHSSLTSTEKSIRDVATDPKKSLKDMSDFFKKMNEKKEDAGNPAAGKLKGDKGSDKAGEAKGEGVPEKTMKDAKEAVQDLKGNSNPEELKKATETLRELTKNLKPEQRALLIAELNKDLNAKGITVELMPPGEQDPAKQKLYVNRYEAPKASGTNVEKKLTLLEEIKKLLKELFDILQGGTFDGKTGKAMPLRERQGSSPTNIELYRGRHAQRLKELGVLEDSMQKFLKEGGKAEDPKYKEMVTKQEQLKREIKDMEAKIDQETKNNFGRYKDYVRRRPAFPVGSKSYKIDGMINITPVMGGAGCFQMQVLPGCPPQFLAQLPGSGAVGLPGFPSTYYVPAAPQIPLVIQKTEATVNNNQYIFNDQRAYITNSPGASVNQVGPITTAVTSVKQNPVAAAVASNGPISAPTTKIMESVPPSSQDIMCSFVSSDGMTVGHPAPIAGNAVSANFREGSLTRIGENNWQFNAAPGFHGKFTMQFPGGRTQDFTV